MVISMQPPVIIWRSLKIDELESNKWCDATHFLGSYWPGASDVQSKIIKAFKEPDRTLMPLLLCLASAYAGLIEEVARREQPDAIVRILASKEISPEPDRPLSLLSARLSETLGIPDRTELFFRADGREPMRYVERLSGSEALRARLQYVVQDIFLRPSHAGSCVLLIDDIYNLGATASVYAAALKRFCGAERVVSVNLAATRFQRGKDGRGDLNLDIERFSSLATSAITKEAKRAWRGSEPFQIGWIGKDDRILHSSPECSMLGNSKARRTLRFLSGPNAVLCAECHPPACSSWIARLMGR